MRQLVRFPRLVLAIASALLAAAGGKYSEKIDNGIDVAQQRTGQGDTTS